MSASWVAGSARARALTGRRLGRGAARDLAASASLEAALQRLVGSPYGRDVRPGQSLVDAQHAVWSTALWHARVIAGWLPRGGAEMLRIMAGPWEIADCSLLLAGERGAAAGPRPFELAALGTAWARLRETTSLTQVRIALASSGWGDPGTTEPSELLAWLRMRWAERLTDVPGAAAWGQGMLAILLARELFLAGRRPEGRRWPVSHVGRAWHGASSIADLAARLPPQARWALEGVEGAPELWAAEAAWWLRVERDAWAMRSAFRPGQREDVVAAVALLTVDAWRVAAALELAAQGGRPLEAFDAVA
jgi:hypothetical protein